MSAAAPLHAVNSTTVADGDTRKESAATLLGLVLGEGVVAALHEGFLNGGDFTAVVPLLVGAGAKPYLATAVRAALATACDAGLAGVAGLLLEADGVRPEDADADSSHVDEAGEDGYTLLQAATRRDDAAIVRVLVESGKADVNWSGDNGQDLPLIIAAEEGRVDCLRALLAADGVMVNSPDSLGYTALMHAAEIGKASCVRALLADARVDVNSVSDYGWSALRCAADGNQTECVRALVGHGGVDLDLANDYEGVFYSWTALHHACSTNNAEAASLLLVAGSCRFALEAADAPGGSATGRAPLSLAGNSKEGQAVRAVFLSGVDYWQHRRHAAHSRAMRDAVLAVMLVRQRLDASPQPAVAVAVAARSTRRRRAAAAALTARALVHLPEEIWLLMCGFLRSADYRRP